MNEKNWNHCAELSLAHNTSFIVVSLIINGKYVYLMLEFC